MSWMKKFKEINTSLDIGKATGYVFKKPIFYTYFIIIFIIVVYIGLQQGFDYKPYLSCEEGLCFNPFYERCDWKYCCEAEWCKQQYLPEGEYGNPPPEWTKHFSDYFLIGLVIVFLINHLIYNRHFKFKKIIKGDN